MRPTTKLKSQVTHDFRSGMAKLPDSVQKQARKAYRLWCADQFHPSLHFKQIHARQPIYSARVGEGWRTLAIYEHNTVTWFWIGTHAEYDKIISRF